MVKNSVKDIDSVVYHNVEDLFEVVGASDENIEKIDSAPYSYWKETFKQFFKHPGAIISLVVLALVILLTIFGPMMKSYRVDVSNIGNPPDDFCVNGDCYIGPNKDNWFGVAGNKMLNFKGYDLWTCVWVGARLSLLLAIVVSLIDTVVGIVVGALWGYFRWLDPILLELRNFLTNVPDILLYFLLMQFLQPSFWVIVFLLTMFGWLGLAGYIRNQIIIIRNREYNIASITLGSSSRAMITHNLLPYLISIIVTVVSTAIPGAVGSEVGLAFFGLSFKATQGNITLGQLLTESAQDDWMTKGHFYILVAPLVVLIPLTVSFFYIGLILADCSDPKNHR